MAFSRRETALLLAGDFLILVFSLWVALTLRNLALPTAGYFLTNVGPFLPIFLLSLVIFFIAGLYEKQTKLVRSIMGTRIFGAQVANVVIAAVTFFALPLTIAPKTILFLYLLVSVALISLYRFFIIPQLGHKSRKRAVLVGTGAMFDEVYNEVIDNDSYTLTFTDRIDTKDAGPGDGIARIRGVIQNGVEIVVIDTRDPYMSSELARLYDAMLSGVTFVDFSTLYEDIFDRVPLPHIDYVWLLDVLPRQHSLYDFAKRLFDIVLATLLIGISVIFVVPAALVLLCTGGEPFIYHERIGKGGRRFGIVKMRTMLMNDHGDPELQKQNRVTAVGKFLRKSRIDELPQLINVFRGDLSFIGPRPELPSIAAVYEKEIPYYHTRHLITPGLSGWAQIRDYDAPRGGADVVRTRRKLSYDLYYVKRRSFGLDMGIALKTLRALLVFSGT